MTKRIAELFDLAVARATRSAERQTIADMARDRAKLLRDAAMSHRISATRLREQSAAARYRLLYQSPQPCLVLGQASNSPDL